MNEVLSWMESASPVVMGGGALLIIRKMSWRWHPALWCFLVTQAYVEALTSAGWVTRDITILIQMLVLGALLAENAKLSRVNFTRRQLGVIAGSVLAICATHAAAQPWTLDYRLSLLRSDIRIAGAVAALCILGYRWRYPMLETHAECYRHRVYRMGVAAWLTVSAFSGAFVRGGLGTWLLPYTPDRWRWIGVSAYASLMVVVIVVSVALNWSAPGRKHAAKTPKGKTVCGLIESERAA